MHKVKRNSDGLLTENCPINIGVKIGSYDCLFKCTNNQNTPKEIERFGFEVPEINCKKANELPKQNNQLEINI